MEVKVRRAAKLQHTDRDPPAAAPSPKTVGERLLICRNATGLTKAESARRIRIAPSSFGELEDGRSKQPAADTLLDMRDKLGYNPDYVIRGRGMPLDRWCLARPARGASPVRRARPPISTRSPGNTMTRAVVLILLALITLAGWASGLLAMMMSSSAIHEILSAIYFLIGTVAFCTSAIMGELSPKQ